MSETPVFSVMPMRYVESVDTLRNFYLEKLGFQHLMGMVGPDGQLLFAILHLNGASMMIGLPMDPVGTTKGPLEIYFQVPDVDAYHAQIQKANLAIEKPLCTQWWGDRNFGIVDPSGTLIWFFQTVADMQIPEGVKVI